MRRAVLLVLLLASSALRVHAQATPAVPATASTAGSSAPASPTEHDAYLLRLGEHFRATHAYYRAIGVFEELSFTTRDAALELRARTNVALCYHLGGQYDAARIEYDALLDRGVSRELEAPLLIARGVADFEAFAARGLRGSVDHFAAQLEPLSARDAQLAPWANYHVARIRLFDGQEAAARTRVAMLLASCAKQAHPVCPSAAVLDRALRSTPPPRTRSPWLGVLLSALVPGLGSVYSERYVDGAYYFVLTGAPLLLAANVYDGDSAFGDQRAAVYVLGGMSAITYLAALVSGYVSAVRFDDAEQYRFHERVRIGTPSPLPFER